MKRTNKFFFKIVVPEYFLSLPRDLIELNRQAISLTKKAPLPLTTEECQMIFMEDVLPGDQRHIRQHKNHENDWNYGQLHYH
jgi:hypothetical protein